MGTGAAVVGCLCVGRGVGFLLGPFVGLGVGATMGCVVGRCVGFGLGGVGRIETTS